MLRDGGAAGWEQEVCGMEGGRTGAELASQGALAHGGLRGESGTTIPSSPHTSAQEGFGLRSFGHPGGPFLAHGRT